MKKRSRIKLLLSLFFLVATTYFGYNIYQSFYQLHNINLEQKKVNSQIKEIETVKRNLEIQKDKLSDPEYKERYARGKFFITKKGEQVFRLPAQSKDE